MSTQTTSSCKELQVAPIPSLVDEDQHSQGVILGSLLLNPRLMESLWPLPFRLHRHLYGDIRLHARPLDARSGFRHPLGG